MLAVLSKVEFPRPPFSRINGKDSSIASSADSQSLYVNFNGNNGRAEFV
jgi:hypothetical protein